MHYIPQLALMASLFSSALASPVDVTGKKTVSIADIKGKKTFSVEQVLAKKTQMQAPAIGMLKTYAKFSAPAPVQLKAAVKAIQAGTVQATPQAVSRTSLLPLVSLLTRALVRYVLSVSSHCWRSDIEPEL